MSNHSETYKSPYSLLNLSSDQSISGNWSELLRKRRKEILAEFDLHNAPAITLDGQSWTKSEVLIGLEELALETQSFHSLIWELGWMDFWRGADVIPANMAIQASWQGQFEQELYDGFEKLLSGRLRELIHHHQYTSILALLSFPFAVHFKLLKKAESPVYDLLLAETLAWRGRIFEIRPEGVESGYLEWFPAMHAELICLLPKRYEEEGSRWATAVLDTSVYLARYLTFERRGEILIPIHPANKYWPKGLCKRWNRFKQSLLSVPQSASIDQKSVSSKRIILQVLFISLGFGLTGYFIAHISPPPVDRIPIEYSPADSVYSLDFQYDTFEFKPYRPGNQGESPPWESPNPTSQSTP